MNSQISDAELVSRVFKGEGKAFSLLVKRYAGMLTGLAYLQVRDRQDAQDIVQQAFVTAYCKLPTLADPGKFGAWLKGIAHNLGCKTLDRRTRLQEYLEKNPHTPTLPSDPHEEFADKSNAQKILNALDELGKTQREAAVLYYFQEMKVQEIARVLGMPAGSIKRILSNARKTLRKELISMAREEFSQYALTEEQKNRLAKIVDFPHNEPMISTKRLDSPAARIKAVSMYGTFPALQKESDVSYARYEQPGAKLTELSHAFVEGPLDVQGKPAFRVNDMSFSPEGKMEELWLPYFRMEGDEVVYCAKQWRDLQDASPLLTPDHPEWDEGQPEPESLILEPGSKIEPHNESNGFGKSEIYGKDGFMVDTHLYEVKIGRRIFQCLRHVTGGAKWKTKTDWSDSPVTVCATEEFFLEDGRLLLWRRYNGQRWSLKNQNPKRKKDSSGTYERLAEAGMPFVEVFGEKYYLWYDHIPEYAL